MRWWLAVALVVTLFVPAAAGGAGCTPLSCGSGQVVLARGALLAVHAGQDAPVRVIDLTTGRTRWRLPGGIVAGGLVVHRDAGLVTWFDLATGARVADAVLQRRGAYALVGASSDGRRAVLARTQRRSTTFALVSPTGTRDVRLAGNRWAFDALNGHRLFLLQLATSGYEVRLYDLATGTLAPKPLSDPRDGALVAGTPFARAASADGRYLFTLYVRPHGRAMIHELDLVLGTAHCVDLPGDGDVGAAMTYGLALDPDPRQLWAVSPGYGKVVAVDVPDHRVRSVLSFTAGLDNGNFSTAVVSPDGERIAFTDAQHLWFAVPARHRVREARPHVAVALGYAPDQSRLWVVGERSRVVALPAG